MPNWTFNTITIEGEKDTLIKFMADGLANAHKPENEGDNPRLYLSSWIPTPETFTKYDTTNHPDGEKLKVGENWNDGLGNHNQPITEELIEEFKQATKEQREKYGVVGWYDYNVKTFGCKWDCEVRIGPFCDTDLTINIDTPWSAPDKWLLTISEKYPELTFYLQAEYEEGFWEDSIYKNGKKVKEETGEYDLEELEDFN